MATLPDSALRIATWNVNSIRKRLPAVLSFLRQYQVDILCLQEIRCTNAVFPSFTLREAGWPYISVNGQKSTAGVAIVSRVPFLSSESLSFCGRCDGRHLAACFPSFHPRFPRFTIHNFYVPAGAYEPDPVSNPKFAHKLDFLTEMSDFTFHLFRKYPDTASLLAGDLNVAPLPNDVWSHRRMINVVSHTHEERTRVNRLLSHGWVDIVRCHIPPPQPLFTWWSYRAKDWQLSNRGRRLDHVWASPALAPAVQSAHVIKALRVGTEVSDHVPVVVTLALPADRAFPRDDSHRLITSSQ